MDPLTIATLGAGAVQGITGLLQKGKAKRMARANKRPVYEIQKPILDNQAIAESRAGQGMSDASRQQLNQANEKGLTSSIDAILAGGGSVNNIADLYGNYQTGTSKMALIDEDMRRQNIQQLIAQNNTLAGEQDKAWQVNVYAPYADKAQAAAALSKQGSDNIWKGVNSMISAGASAATANQYKDQANNVYGKTGVGLDEPVVTTPGGINPNGSVNPYNWYKTTTDTPQIPMTPEQRAANQVQTQYPGLMMGNMGGGFDMTLFNGQG